MRPTQYFSLSIVLLLCGISQAATYAIVNPSTTIINIVSWDGVSSFNVSPNTLVATNGNLNAQIGGTFSGGVFTAPIPGAAAPGILFSSVPVAAGTTTCPAMAVPPGGAGYRQQTVELLPAASISGQTVVLPPSPQDGDRLFLISPAFAITNLAISSPGVNQVNIPATFTLAAGVSQRVQFYAQLNAWVRL